MCNGEAPGVAQVARRYEDRVPIVGMAGRDDTGPMKEFVERHGLGFVPHAVDADGSLWAEFGVRGQPAWVFVDRDGQAEVVFGTLSERQLAERLDALADA